MDYSISEMAARFGIQPHTLRYYEKEGILHPRRTASGVRRYSEEDVAQLEMAMCLKSTGMPLKDIRRYFDLVAAGNHTLEQRLEMFVRHRKHVVEEIDTLQKYLEKIDCKIQWIEETAGQNR